MVIINTTNGACTTLTVMKKHTENKLHYKALGWAFGADEAGNLRLPDTTTVFIEKLQRKGFILDYEYKTKLLQIERPDRNINLGLCLKPIFSSMPVAYFIEFFDSTK